MLPGRGADDRACRYPPTETTLSSNGTPPESPAAGAAHRGPQHKEPGPRPPAPLRAAAWVTGAALGLTAAWALMRDPVAAGAGIAALALGASAWRSLLRRGGWRSRPAATTGAAVLLLVAGAAAGPLGWGLGGGGGGAEPAGCEDPVELTVLLPVDGAAEFASLLTAFNARLEDGCRTANVTAYDAPWPAVEQAMAQGWQSVRAGGAAAPLAPLRDLGPAPHLWIAESRTQIDLAATHLAGSPAGAAVLGAPVAIGSTPLVLAVPQEVRERGFNDGSALAQAPLPDLVDELDAAYGVPVLRSDPTASHTALLFLRALYGEGADRLATGERIENRLAEWAAALGITLAADDTELLCGLVRSQGGSPDAAVLTTEAALARYNAGRPLGADCATAETARSGLVPVYGEAFGSLDYQAVPLDWPGGDREWERRRAAVAQELVAWLTDPGAARLPSIGVRGDGYDGGAIEGDVQFAKDFTYEPAAIDLGLYDDLRGDYGDNRLPTDVLLAIDHSETMDEESRDGASRYELAADGVVTARRYLGADDRMGLWTFPADGTDSHVELLGIGEDRDADLEALLAGAEGSSGVDLHQTIVDGAAALEDTGGGDRHRAMVVLTDGEDADRSDTSVAEVHAALEDSQVTLYVIAVGERSCRSPFFDDLKGEETRVTCLDAAPEQITITFDDLFDRLWSGDEQ